MKNIALFIFLPIHIPHLLIFYLSGKKDIIVRDLKHHTLKWEWDLVDLLYFITFRPEFRATFYYRIGSIRYLIQWLHPIFLNLYILTPNIGPGLRIQHGFSTVIAAKSIGENFWVNQQVTIGYTNGYDCPVIGDNVSIGAGAIVIGDITVGNNSTIGAGAVVTKSIPPNCTVVGNPARIIKKDGIKIDITL